MKLSLDRETEIIEISDDVASQATSSGKVCPVKICADKGIELTYGGYGAGKFDGMLAYRRSSWVIVCNTDNGNIPGSTRSRFTIAHELGHFHIPEHRRMLMSGCPSHGSYVGAFDGANRIEELEADTFAANLLMPPSRFIPRMEAVKQTPLAAILRLRSEFETSVESTTIHALKHHKNMMVISKWADDLCKWHRIADSTYNESGYRKFKIRDRQQVQPDSALAKAFQDGDDKFDGQGHQCILPAYYCFHNVVAGKDRDILLYEEAFRNGRFGVIAIYSRLGDKLSRSTNS